MFFFNENHQDPHTL